LKVVVVNIALAATLLFDSACADRSVPLTSVGDEIEAAICSLWTRCGYASSEAECRTIQHYFVGQLIADAQAGRVDYDSNKMADCLDALRAGGCEYGALRRWPAACRAAIAGTVETDGACISAWQCKSLFCYSSSTAACAEGRCAGQAGEACSANDLACEAGIQCDQQTLLCERPLAQQNTACTSTSQCDEGLTCFLNLVNGLRTCMPVVATGASCTIGACAQHGDYCDSKTQICTPLVAPGAACDEFSTCQAPYTCDLTAHRCVPEPAVNEACNGSCQGGLFCNSNGYCETKRLDGAPCEGSDQCGYFSECDQSASPIGTCIASYAVCN
jgi:hypothetical protein